jgi:hypothetical protein
VTPEQLAANILRAAGSNLTHYTPYAQDRIIQAAREGLETANTRAPTIPDGWPTDEDVEGALKAWLSTSDASSFDSDELEFYSKEMRATLLAGTASLRGDRND